MASKRACSYNYLNVDDLLLRTRGEHRPTTAIFSPSCTARKTNYHNLACSTSWRKDSCGFLLSLRNSRNWHSNNCMCACIYIGGFGWTTSPTALVRQNLMEATSAEELIALEGHLLERIISMVLSKLDLQQTTMTR